MYDFIDHTILQRGSLSGSHPCRESFTSLDIMCLRADAMKSTVLLSIALLFERPLMRACERGTSVILHSPRKATEKKEPITKAVCRVFEYHFNAHALSTLTRTLPRVFEVKRNRQ